MLYTKGQSKLCVSFHSCFTRFPIRYTRHNNIIVRIEHHVQYCIRSFGDDRHRNVQFTYYYSISKLQNNRFPKGRSSQIMANRNSAKSQCPTNAYVVKYCYRIKQIYRKNFWSIL